MDEREARQTYLLAECEQAHSLTHRVDELRHKVTTVFLAFAAAACGGMVIYIKGESKALSVDVAGTVAVLFEFVAMIGVFAVCVLARLRRAQLEHFRIINNIRMLFLGDDLRAWNAVQLSAQTLPNPTRGSGTYFWFAQIGATVALLAGIGAFLSLLQTPWTCSAQRMWIGGAVAVAVFALLDRTYMRMARPKPPKHYEAVPG